MKLSPPLYKTPFGKTIDLSKIVYIDDAWFRQECYGGAAHVGFNIMYDNTIDRYEEEVDIADRNSVFCENGIYSFIYNKDEDGDVLRVQNPERNLENLVCVQKLQAKVNEIIKVWSEYKSIIFQKDTQLLVDSKPESIVKHKVL